MRTKTDKKTSSIDSKSKKKAKKKSQSDPSPSDSSENEHSPQKKKKKHGKKERIPSHFDSEQSLDNSNDEGKEKTVVQRLKEGLFSRFSLLKSQD